MLNGLVLCSYMPTVLCARQRCFLWTERSVPENIAAYDFLGFFRCSHSVENQREECEGASSEHIRRPGVLSVFEL